MTEDVIQAITPPDSTTYYTDGSLDPLTCTAGSAFVTEGRMHGRRTSDTSSTLQTEAVAIVGALEHSLVHHKMHVVIHTDSKATIDSLRHEVPRDNIRLLTTIQVLLHRLQSEGRRVILNWVPSHIGVIGNELADKAAEIARKRPRVDLVIHPSKEQLSGQTTAVANKRALAIHKTASMTSPSAQWYRRATAYEPLGLTRDMKRSDEITLHRLRLGYPCYWEIVPDVAEDECCCKLCNAPNTSLQHYLAECEETAFLRSGPHTTPEGLVRRLCDSLSVSKLQWLDLHKPPR